MNAIAEIKKAIHQLSREEREELEAWLHPDWDQPLPIDQTPPGIKEKLAAAAQGKFQSGDRTNIGKILTTLK